MTTAEASAPSNVGEQAAAAAVAAEEQKEPAASSAAEVDELDELVDFLDDRHRPEIRLEACKLVEGLTGDAAGQERLISKSARLLPPLLRRATEEEEEEGGSAPSSRRPALAALVNLSQDPGVAKSMLKLGAVQRAMDSLREQKKGEAKQSSTSASSSISTSLAASLTLDPKSPPPPLPSRSDMLLMLLSNLTALEEGAASLLQLGKAKVEGFNLAVLLHRFLAGEAEGVASLLANATALPDGRRLLVGPSGAFGAVAQAAFGGGDGGGERESGGRALSAAARHASAAALRNCCLAAARDGTTEEIAKEEKALAAMLRALCGEKRPQKEKEGEGGGEKKKLEVASGAGGAAAWAGTDLSSSAISEDSTKDPDPGVRAALAEAILVLADDDEIGRPLLWKLDAPELLRQGYEDEEDAATCEALERTAEVFLAGAGGVDEVFDEEGGEEKKEETEDERRWRGRSGMMRA